MQNTSKIIAKFTGADGSMGYRTDQIYILEVMPPLIWVKMRRALSGTSPLAVRRTQSLYERLTRKDDGMCPYDTFEAFKANWEVLEVISQKTRKVGMGKVLKWLPFL